MNQSESSVNTPTNTAMTQQTQQQQSAGSFTQLPPRPSIEKISPTDFLELQKRLKQFNDWMDIPGISPLHKQDKETRNFYMKCESDYNECLPKVRKAIQDNVGLEGFTQEDADEAIEIMESTEIEPEKKRGYGCFVSATLKRNEMALQQQEEIRNQLTGKKRNEVESLENFSFDHKKVRRDEGYTQKSTTPYLIGNRGSSSKTSYYQKEEEEEEMDEEPRVINLLSAERPSQEGYKVQPLAPVYSKHVYKMLAESVSSGIPALSTHGKAYDAVMRGFKSQHTPQSQCFTVTHTQNLK